MHENEDYPGELETDVAAFIDPRTVANGIRVVCAEESFMVGDIDTINQNPNKEYKVMRLINGLLEGSHEIGGQFPQNMNMQAINGVSNFEAAVQEGMNLSKYDNQSSLSQKRAIPFAIHSLPKVRLTL